MRIIILFLFLFIIPNWVEAQYSKQLKLDHLTHEDGLSHSSGNAILKDSYGYMWFGTANGLNKYNGYDITVYQHAPDDSSTISGNRISTLYEDSNGDLWIGTSGAGLNRYNRDQDSFTRFTINYNYPHLNISDNSVSDVIEDKDGNFWIGTANGLNLFDRKSNEFTHHHADDSDSGSLSSSTITTLYTDNQDRLWIGTDQGLNYWNPDTGNFGHYKHDPSDPNSISHNNVMDIYEDRNGNFWIGTYGGGLNLLDRENETFTNYKHDEDNPYSISGNIIFSILEDSQGILWIGTENEGLNSFDIENEQFYSHKSNVSNPASLNHNTVNVLYESNDRILWIASFSGGISFLDRKDPQFEHYYHDPFDPKPLNNNSVVSFLETSDGIILVGTDGGGLNVFDKETHEFTLYRHNPDDPSSLSSDVILSLHEDRDGRIWIGYYDGGLTVYDPEDESIKHYRNDPNDPHSLSNDHVFVIHEGRDGELWFGTNGGGINQLVPETGQFKVIGTDTEGTDVTRALYDDNNGNLWVGSYGGGLIQLDKEDGSVLNQYFEGPNGLTSNVVLAIHEDQDDRFWIGTNEGGLHLFDRNSDTFTSYSVNEGLPSPVVLGILEDPTGNLWMSTVNGLVKFDPETEEVSNYNVEHGLQYGEFNPLAYYQDSNGIMYFGGVNGFNRFHPDQVVINQSVPPVVLTNFSIFNESLPVGGDSPLQKHISQTEEITLPHTASVLTFDYVALNFNKNKGDEFAYMLEGFDSDWNYVNQRRNATYTNLNPGEYIFRVKAANNYGVWSESDRSLALTITPPFWQTSWFYVLSILFMSGAIGGLIRWRIQNITEQNKRLEEEVSRQTSALFEKNSELEKTLTELKQTRSELVEKAHKAGMADLATNVLHNVGNILNSVNISSSLIDETLRNSKLNGLKKANQLLREHSDDLKNFILNNPKGEKLLHYYLKLEEPVNREYEVLTTQNNRLAENIKLIIDVVNTQQSFANAGRIFERVSLKKLVEDTLILQSATIERHGLTIIREYEDVDKINVEKSKMIHTIVNLLKNAKESMSDLDSVKKKLTLKIFQDEDYIYLAISDTGTGIKTEHLDKIFTHGFTTKTYGHGFGLHSCANYMKELNGKIDIHSDGPDKGTTVTLGFSRHHKINGEKTSPLASEMIDSD